MSQNEEKLTLPDLLDLAINSKLCDVNTCLPATVESYDRATQTCSVQPSLRRKYKSGEVVDLPIINRVPVVFPRAAGRGVHFDLEAGDAVTLVFSQRSLDIWKEKGGTVSPDDPRKFHLSDAYAFPGGHPVTTPLAPKGEEGSIELQNGEDFLVIEADGTFKLKNSGGFLEMDPGGKFQLTNNTEELLDLLSQTVELLSTTTTNTIFGPMKLNDFAQFAILKTKIDTLKGGG